MILRPAHTVIQNRRRLTALVMAAIYTLILLVPLAAPVMQQAGGGAQATARECAGDCSICGCSPESRAANTCCCSKKRQQVAHIHDDGETDEPECCKKERAANKPTVISCGCPCDDGKHTLIFSADSSEIIPFHFTEHTPPPHADTLFPCTPRHMTSRHAEPPEQPPKLT